MIQSLAYAYISSAAADAIAFVVLFLIILIRPTGSSKADRGGQPLRASAHKR